MRSALFLDRDGVVNVDRGYVCRVEDFQFCRGIFNLTRTARRLGHAIVVVTNQSGIGRGYYSAADYERVTAHMRDRFEREGTPLDAVYYCPFHPDAVEERYRAADHPWRKPRPGMLLAARDDLSLDLASSTMVGDRWSDMSAAASAGVGHLMLVGNAAGPRPPDLPASIEVVRVADLAAALAALFEVRRSAHA